MSQIKSIKFIERHRKNTFFDAIQDQAHSESEVNFT